MLFAGTLPSGLTSHAEAYINEGGDLVVEVQDFGQQLEQLFGDTDYEWWVIVRASQKQRLVRSLLEQHGHTPPDEDTSERDALLLSLIERQFGGRPSAPSDLRKWLTETEVPYEVSTYS
jgi:hypothetical protein